MMQRGPERFYFRGMRDALSGVSLTTQYF